MSLHWVASCQVFGHHKEKYNMGEFFLHFGEYVKQ